MAKPRTTRSGLLAEPYGERPYVVTLREEKAAGTYVVLDYRAPTRRKEHLGYPVRRKDGRRWNWDDAALDRARDEARDRSAQLRLGALRGAAQPQDLSVAEAFALFNDPQRGGLPPSSSARLAHLRAEKVWVRWLGAETPWNRIVRSDVDALMRDYATRTSPVTGKAMIPTGVRYVEILRTCHHWLEEKRGVDDLRDPTRGFAWGKWRRKHKPRRPRYTQDEQDKVLAVRYGVDPRFALYLALVQDSGARGKAVRTLWRSMVDGPLDQGPTEDQAPFGWVEFPALKGQDTVLHFLTAFERREMEQALEGYLREMEAAWTEHGTDYPLFPAVRRESLTRERPVRPSQARALQAVSPTGPRLWLREAEDAAGVEHIGGRGYHGFRRSASDYLWEETDLKTLTTAGGWTSQRTPEQIYLEKRRHPERAKAREAMERKRTEGTE